MLDSAFVPRLPGSTINGRMPPIILHFDLLWETLHHVPVIELLSLSQTCRSVRYSVRRFIGLIIRRHLSPYIPDPRSLLAVMRSHGAIIGGDVALNISLHALRTRSMRYTTLQIYVPLGDADIFEALMASLGYGKSSMSPTLSLFTEHYREGLLMRNIY